MSINDLFEKKRLRFFGLAPFPYRDQKCKNSWCDLYCQLNYGIVDDENKKIIYFSETLSNEGNMGGVAEAENKVANKIWNLENMFGPDKKRSFGASRFIDLECMGIFYKDELIAITNDEDKKCLDPLLKNEAKDIEEFKKEFIKLKEVELEKERYMHEKRAEEICAEISHIIQHTS